ncbi:polysaccharide deacetylase family protein [Acidimangrovimonas sediminis]|uniref:polysaccharide deacetylase family protein n=1 Tax=Acidimangrovimonas sediminis TaxID=2056283 RepID=UPI000C7FEE36|nr:polysaccharide deacetylase family protein [Acidimangrovimonas sediminis]
MSDTHDPFAPLRAALDRRADTGVPARFWLRDDDAVTPGAALDQLLALGAEAAVPLTLAVIPRDTGAPLAARLAGAPQLRVAVHGWAHENHAPPGEKKQELGPHRPAGETTAELTQGLEKLRDIYGARCLPMLVPPWNRIDRALLPALAEAGFRTLSVFGPERPGPLTEMNTHVDLIDWHGTRGGRPAAALVAEIVARMDRMGPEGTMGFLTHHLVHDAAAWAFIEALFAATAAHPGCVWIDPGAAATG